MTRFAIVLLLSIQAPLHADPLVDQLTAQFSAPSPSVRILVSSPNAAFTVTSPEGGASSTQAVRGLPFAESQVVTVAKAFDQSWKALAVSHPVPGSVAKEHAVLVSFWARAAGGPGQIRAYLEKSSAEWTTHAYASVEVGEEWKQFYLSGVLKEDVPASGMHVSLHLGQRAQTVELGGLVVLDLGRGVTLNRLPHNALVWPGQEPDAPWRARAATAIESLRRGPLEVRVVDARGLPVAGARVEVKQVRREFSFGSYTGFGEVLLAPTKAGATYRAFYGRLFDRATVPLYWADWGWLRWKDRFVELARWARDQGLAMRGHVLVYPGYQFMPESTKKLSGRDLQKAFLKQIGAAGEAMRGVPLREVDVANELRDLTEVPGLVGKEGVAEWFRAARAAFPEAKLALNENTILTEGGATEANQDTLLEWYRFLKSRGVAPDVLGFQGHFSENLTDPEKVWAILDRFARETDAELQITEFDIDTSNEEAKAAYTRDFLTAVFAHPRVTSATLWGFWEGDHWKPDAAEWNRDWTPRPAGLVLEELLGKTWRTDETGTTDEQGTVSRRVWLGILDVTVTLGSTSVTKRIGVGGQGPRDLTVVFP